MAVRMDNSSSSNPRNKINYNKVTVGFLLCLASFAPPFFVNRMDPFGPQTHFLCFSGLGNCFRVQLYLQAANLINVDSKPGKTHSKRSVMSYKLITIAVNPVTMQRYRQRVYFCYVLQHYYQLTFRVNSKISASLHVFRYIETER